jgi:hypothetical protein
VRTIGINDIGLTEKWLDIWYAADWTFWKHYQGHTSEALKVCAGRKAIERGFADLLLNVRDAGRASQFVPGYAISGGHSGFQALQLAISLGASRVVLLGYDCKPKGKVTNYFGTKCAGLNRPSDYQSWPQFYRDLKLPSGVEVLNATPGSAIDAYPNVSIDSLLSVE